MSTFEFAQAGAPEGVFPFPSARFTIGSGPNAALRFDPTLVQALHAEVAIDSKGVPWIRDLTNQSLLWVNDVVVAKAALSAGARVRLGRLDLVIRASGQAAAPRASGVGQVPNVAAARVSQANLKPVTGTAQPAQRPPTGAQKAVQAAPQRPPTGTAQKAVTGAPGDVPLDATAKRPTPFATVPLDATAKRPTPFASPPVPLDSTAKRPTPFRSMPVGGRASGSQWKPVLTAAPPEAMEHGDEATRRSARVPDPPTNPEAPAAEPLPPDRTVLPEGAVIGGRYRIIKKLAAGGMGEVYQAEHVELHKQFAVKVMLPALSADPEFVNRFKREAISASRIGQLNIIDISDFGQTEDDGRFYFVMEFLDGVTIASLLHREGPMPTLRMVNVALQVSRALAAAHAQGIVHRDMKPENVMVLQRPGQADFVKVLDFGVAKVSKGPGEGGQTQLGLVVGTPQYMSPEQAMGVAVDARTDTYALGLIFYEMLTGKPTFVGDTASILMVKQVTEPTPPLPEAVAAVVPAALNDLIFKMLEKDPNQRPASMDEVVAVLENLQAHLKVGAVLPPATTSGRFPQTATPHQLSPVRVTSSGVPMVARPSGTQIPPVATAAAAAGGGTELNAVHVPAAETTQPAAPRSKVGLIAAAAVVLLVAGGGLAWSMREPPPAPPPTPDFAPPPPLTPIKEVAKEPEKEPVKEAPPEPAKVEVVKLSITTTPTGAQVRRDGALIGLTPIVIEVNKGQKQELELSMPGYAKEHINAEPIADLPLDVQLRKVAVAKQGAPGPGEPKPPKPPKPGGDNPYGEQVKDLADDPYQ